MCVVFTSTCSMPSLRRSMQASHATTPSAFEKIAVVGGSGIQAGEYEVHFHLGEFFKWGGTYFLGGRIGGLQFGMGGFEGFQFSEKFIIFRIRNNRCGMLVI